MAKGKERERKTMNKPIPLWDLKQRSPEWETIRTGIPTASEFSRIVPASGKPSTSKDKSGQHGYRADLVAEAQGMRRSATSAAIEWGAEIEDNARSGYELHTGITVAQVGFVYGDASMLWGCSPDCVTLDLTGGCQLKVPEYNTLLRYHSLKLQREEQGLEFEIPTENRAQIYGEMYTCGAEWWDWYAHSYTPGTPPIVVRTLNTDKSYTKWAAAFSEELPVFLRRLNELRQTCSLPPLHERDVGDQNAVVAT